MDLPAELIEGLAAGKGAIFVGAGLSIGAGLPDWEELVNRLGEKLSNCPKNAPYPDIAQFYENQFERNSLIQQLKKELDTFQKEPTSAHRALVALPVKRIFTTNFDDLLEKALRLSHIKFESIVDDVQAHLLGNDTDLCLIKLHGNLNPTQGIVITADDYERYLNTHPSLARELAFAFQTFTLLFVGYSITDPDFRQLLTQVREEARGFPRNAFSLQFNVNSLTADELKRRHIRVINLEPGDQPHKNSETSRDGRTQVLTQWLQELHKELQRKAAAQHGYSPQVIRSQSVAEVAREVEFWLRARGYTIEKHISHEGYEDLLARLPEGLRFLVRCVDGEIELRHVRQLQRDCAEEDLQLGWIICYKRIAQSARLAIKDLDNIHIYNIADFMKDIFGPYFNHLNDLVEQSDIQQYYVDLGCEKPVFDDGGKPLPSELYDKYPIIDRYIDEWLTEPGKNQISILGEFGQGKTWFCRHYAYRQLQQYLRDPINHRIPFLIALRDYRSGDIRQLITDLLVNRYQIKISGNYELFQMLNQSGRLLLIFDGFDEMTPEVDDKITKENFEALADTAVPGSKVLLTCRTPYFRTMMEERSVFNAEGQSDIRLGRPNFEILYLQEFDEEQIKQVLRKRVPSQWEEYMQRIRDVFDLPNLAQRPVMLDMIVKTLPALEGLESINHALLYQTYTDEWIEKEIQENRALLDAASKRFFAQEVAWEMFKSRILTIHASQMSALVSRYLRPKLAEPEDIIFLEHDVRTSSFLSKRDERGNYEFMHRSFMEFFVAQKLAEAIRDGDKEPLEKQTIYYEIIRFLNQMLRPAHDIPKMLEWWDDADSNENLRANCIRLSGQWLDEKVLDKLIAVVRAPDELFSLRRDAIRSITRILHGEEADWAERQVRITIQAFAIRMSRETLTVACLPISVKLLHETPASDDRSRLVALYRDEISKLFLDCLKSDEPEIRINASYGLIHFAQEGMIPTLLKTAQNDPDQYVRFNSFAALIAMDVPDKVSLQNIAKSYDSQLTKLAELNLAIIASEKG